MQRGFWQGGPEDEHKHLRASYLTMGLECLSGAPQRNNRYISKDDGKRNYTMLHKWILGASHAKILIIKKMLGKIWKKKKKVFTQTCSIILYII